MFIKDIVNSVQLFFCKKWKYAAASARKKSLFKVFLDSYVSDRTTRTAFLKCAL